MLPCELWVPVPGALRGCMYKLTRGGAGQEPGADPLPPLLPPPGVDSQGGLLELRHGPSREHWFDKVPAMVPQA